MPPILFNAMRFAALAAPLAALATACDDGSSSPRQIGCDPELGPCIRDFSDVGDVFIPSDAADGGPDATSIDSTPPTSDAVPLDPPTFRGMPEEITVNEGETFNLPIRASHIYGAVDITAEGMDNLPGEVVFEPNPGGNLADFRYIPSFRAADQDDGEYEITFRAKFRGTEPGVSEATKVVKIHVIDQLGDFDGDGWMEDVDCNDDDRDTYPLVDGRVYRLDRTTTICPGIYEGVRIVARGDSMTISGEDVILDGGVFRREVDGLIEGSPGAAISIVGRDTVTVQGFDIRRYYEGIRVEDSIKITLDVNGIHEILEQGHLLVREGIQVFRTNDGEIRVRATDSRVTVRESTGLRVYESMVDREDIVFIYCTNSSVEDSVVTSGKIFIGGSANITVCENQLHGDLERSKILLVCEGEAGCGNSRILDNEVSGYMGGHLSAAIYLEGDNLTVDGNIVTDNTEGIRYIGHDGIFSGNRVQFCTGEDAFSIAMSISGSPNIIDNNIVTDNNGYGVWASGPAEGLGDRSNRFTNNDFGRNRLGNRLHCQNEPNREDRLNFCEGNQPAP
jgi:hypothetical protein